MEGIISIMEPFFEDPDREFGIRELSRATGINHMTVRMRLRKMVSDGLLKTRKSGIYERYAVDFTKQYANLKLYYNLEKIRKSGMVEFIERKFDYPVLEIGRAHV
jgi:DNA-binding Lrp family transcriptional regulator